MANVIALLSPVAIRQGQCVAVVAAVCTMNAVTSAGPLGESQGLSPAAGPGSTLGDLICRHTRPAHKISNPADRTAKKTHPDNLASSMRV